MFKFNIFKLYLLPTGFRTPPLLGWCCGYSIVLVHRQPPIQVGVSNCQYVLQAAVLQLQFKPNQVLMHFKEGIRGRGTVVLVEYSAM